jgi:hypothetical protein
VEAVVQWEAAEVEDANDLISLLNIARYINGVKGTNNKIYSGKYFTNKKAVQKNLDSLFKISVISFFI